MPSGARLDLDFAAALADVRLTSSADLALVYAARSGQPLACIAADADAGSRWVQAGSTLLGSQIRPDHKLGNARRQNRAITVPTADLPAVSPKGVRIAGLDLPPWCAVLPLSPGSAV